MSESAVPIYRAVMLEIERRRAELGIGMERLSETAGIADRAYAKALYPDTESGRLARWQTIQFIMDALFPDGWDLEIRARNGPMLTAMSMRYRIALANQVKNPKTYRQAMRELSRMAAEARASKIPRERRELIARKAARARWRKAEKERKLRRQKRQAGNESGPAAIGNTPR